MTTDGLKGLALVCLTALSLTACSSRAVTSQAATGASAAADASASAQSTPADDSTTGGAQQTPATASELPAEQPVASGMFAGWVDDASFTIQPFGGGGRGEDPAATPVPAEASAITVLVTADTILYEDASVMPRGNSPDGTPGMPPTEGIPGAGPGGPGGFTMLPQAVTPVMSLEAMVDRAQVTVWGTLENNQVTASVIVYRNGGGMRQPQ